MNGTFKTWTVMSVLLIVVLLAACGGGGGGDSFTPISYDGAASLATIDETNAGEFAALAENGADMVGSTPIPMSVSATSADEKGIPVPVLQSILELNKKLPGYVEDNSVADSVAAASQTYTQNCGVDGSMTITESVNGSQGTATITFNSCDEGVGIVFNGAIALSTNDAYADPSATQVTINVTYRNLQMNFTDIAETITVYAAMSMTMDETEIDPVYSTNISDLIMKDSATGLTARISNYKITVTEVSDPVAGFYDEIEIASASLKARVYDHLLGYVEFYTLTPIKDDGIGPYEGIIHIDGADGTWAEIDFGNDCSLTDNGEFFDGTILGTFCYVPSL